MKKINILLNIVFFFELIIPILNYEYIYEPEEVINYINQEKMSNEDLESIIDYFINIFNDAYAFNEISANPPQPPFQNNYHEKTDIIVELNEMKEKVKNNEIIEVYDFYSEIINIISKLKDSHIQINWSLLNLDDFFILAPVDFYVKDVDGIPKVFSNCVTEEFENSFDQDVIDTLDICDTNDESPIISINGYDPFDYINYFGNYFSSTKNEHASFSFRLKFHNDLPLNYYPFKLDEFEQLQIEFESGDIINSKFFIGSNLDINNGDRRNLRNLQKNNININKKNKLRKYLKKRKLNNQINWNFKNGDDIKCYEDSIKEINIYYISTFAPDNKDNYLKVIEYCSELFDKNNYPIVVINDLNEGGFVYLSQIFLGIISPLMSINLYKGRIRITDSFKESEEINYYIETNMTSSENCLHTNYDRLTSQKIHVNYGENLENDLTQMFFINNITIHNYIETARNKMKHKRKPTEILIYTDGYTFSAASLFMQYLQKSGGGIIASYLGNPNHKNDKYFDISQSPSPVFTHNLLEIFSPENYNLLNSNKENGWKMQMPGIQSFYDSNDYEIPLEYEVILPDINSNIYECFDEELYEKFMLNAKNIFEKFKNECNPNNTNLVKVTDECDNTFGNTYTHGGYECGDDGKWTNNCVPSYCDPGYFFNKNKKKCVKDICSSIPIKIIDNEIDETNIKTDITIDDESNRDETNIKTDITKDDESNRKNSYGTNIYYHFLYIALLFSFILI